MPNPLSFLIDGPLTPDYDARSSHADRITPVPPPLLRRVIPVEYLSQPPTPTSPAHRRSPLSSPLSPVTPFHPSRTDTMPVLRNRNKGAAQIPASSPSTSSATVVSPSGTPTPAHSASRKTGPGSMHRAGGMDQSNLRVEPMVKVEGFGNPVYGGMSQGEGNGVVYSNAPGGGFAVQTGQEGSLSYPSTYLPSATAPFDSPLNLPTLPPSFQDTSSSAPSDMTNGHTLPPLQIDYQQSPSGAYQMSPPAIGNGVTAEGHAHKPSLPSFSSLTSFNHMGYTIPQQGRRTSSGTRGPPFGIDQPFDHVHHAQGSGSTQYRQESESCRTTYVPLGGNQAQEEGPQIYASQQAVTSGPGGQGQQMYPMVQQVDDARGQPIQAQYHQVVSQPQPVFIDQATGRQIIVKRESSDGQTGQQAGEEPRQPQYYPMQPHQQAYQLISQPHHGMMTQGGMVLQQMQMMLQPQMLMQHPQPGRLIQPPMPWIEQGQGRDEYGNAVAMEQSGSSGGAHGQNAVVVAREIDQGYHQHPMQRLDSEASAHASDAPMSAPPHSAPSTPALSTDDPNSGTHSRSTTIPSPIEMPARTHVFQGQANPAHANAYAHPVYVNEYGQTVAFKMEPQEHGSHSSGMVHGQPTDSMEAMRSHAVQQQVEQTGRNIYTVGVQPGTGSSGWLQHPSGQVSPASFGVSGGSDPQSHPDANLMVSRWRTQRSVGGSVMSSRGDSPASTTFSTSASYLSPGFGHMIHTDGSHSDQSRVHPLGTISPSSMFEFGMHPTHGPFVVQGNQGYHKSGLLRALNMSDDTVSSSEGDGAQSQPLSPENPIGPCFTSGTGSRITLPPIITTSGKGNGTVSTRRIVPLGLQVMTGSVHTPTKRAQMDQVSAMRTTTAVGAEVSDMSNSSDRDGEDEDEDDEDDESEENYDNQGSAGDTRFKRKRLGPIKANVNKLPNPVPDKNVKKRPRGRVVATDPAMVNSNVVHVCPIAHCGACFKRREHVKRHIRGLHTDEKPWPCKYGDCPKTFSRGDNLKAHYLSVHKVPAAEVDERIRDQMASRPGAILRKTR